MSKQIKPGMPCIIKGSLFNDGRIVTPVEYLGIMNWITPEGKEFKAPGWKLAEKLHKPHECRPENLTACLASVLFPLDNPGDDEIDVVSFRKEKENV